MSGTHSDAAQKGKDFLKMVGVHGRYPRIVDLRTTWMLLDELPQDPVTRRKTAADAASMAYEAYMEAIDPLTLKRRK